MSQFGICGLQLFLSGQRNNTPYICERIRQMHAAFPWVHMVVLSELAAHGPLPSLAESLPGPTENTLAALAKELSLWIVTGSLYEKSGSKLHNTCSVINPQGVVIGRYRKIFPFVPYSTGIEPGTEFFTFDVPHAGRFGISICYDMWIPEHSRTLMAMGADVILHPVLTPTIDRDIELAIARATAATNQVYVIDINGVGAGGVGRSSFIGPDGDILHQAGDTEAMIPLEIDLSLVKRSRERGLKGLGQVVKSFRDSPVTFDVYKENSPLRAHLSQYGPLAKPTRLTLSASPSVTPRLP